MWHPPFLFKPEPACSPLRGACALTMAIHWSRRGVCLLAFGRHTLWSCGTTILTRTLPPSLPPSPHLTAIFYLNGIAQLYPWNGTYLLVVYIATLPRLVLKKIPSSWLTALYLPLLIHFPSNPPHTGSIYHRRHLLRPALLWYRPPARL